MSLDCSSCVRGTRNMLDSWIGSIEAFLAVGFSLATSSFCCRYIDEPSIRAGTTYLSYPEDRPRYGHGASVCPHPGSDVTFTSANVVRLP